MKHVTKNFIRRKFITFLGMIFLLIIAVIISLGIFEKDIEPTQEEFTVEMKPKSM